MGLHQLNEVDNQELSGELLFLGCLGKEREIVLLEVVTQAFAIQFNELGLPELLVQRGWGGGPLLSGGYNLRCNGVSFQKPERSRKEKKKNE